MQFPKKALSDVESGIFPLSHDDKQRGAELLLLLAVQLVDSVILSHQTGPKVYVTEPRVSAPKQN